MIPSATQHSQQARQASLGCTKKWSPPLSSSAVSSPLYGVPRSGGPNFLVERIPSDLLQCVVLSMVPGVQDTRHCEAPGQYLHEEVYQELLGLRVLGSLGEIVVSHLVNIITRYEVMLNEVDNI